MSIKKRYECLSKYGPETSLMSAYFTIGKIYTEAEEDYLGENQADEYSLLLDSDYTTTDGHPVPMYVDKQDFQIVAIRNQICLN